MEGGLCYLTDGKKISFVGELLMLPQGRASKLRMNDIDRCICCL